METSLLSLHICEVSLSLLSVEKLTTADLCAEQPDYTLIWRNFTRYAFQSSHLHFKEISKLFQHHSPLRLRGNSCGKVRGLFSLRVPFAPRIHPARINQALLGLFRLVETWLCAPLSFTLGLVFMQIFSQDGFGFVSVRSCVKTALWSHTSTGDEWTCWS